MKNAIDKIETLLRLIRGKQNLKIVALNSWWLIVEKLIKILLGFTISVLVVRYLGPEKYGLLNYAIALVSLFSAFSVLGLNRIITRELVEKPHNQKSIVGTALYLRLFGGFISYILSLLLIFFIDDGNITRLLLVGLVGFSLIPQSFDVIDYYFQSKHKNKYSVLARTISALLAAIFKLWLIVNYKSLYMFGLAWTLEYVFSSLFLVLIYKRNGENVMLRNFQFPLAKAFLKESWPLILSGVMVSLYMRVDQIMLAKLTNFAQVGEYAAAIQLTETLYFIPTILITSIFPYIVRIKKRHPNLYKKRISQLFSILVATSYLIAIPTTFLSKYIVQILYGNQYEVAGRILAVHIWTLTFVSLGLVQGIWLVSERLTRLSLYRTTGGAVVSILLNFILIPKFGAMGSAISALFSYGCAGVFMNLFDKRTKQIFIEQIRALFLVGILNTNKNKKY